VTTVKLAYVRRHRGNLFWAPTKAMRAAGFLAKPLGPDGPEAQGEALRLYAAWLKAKAELAKVTEYPAGSLGAYYDRYRRSKAWARKKPRTREDYERAWKHVGPAFGRKILTAIGATDVEDFAELLEAKVSPSERYRTIKVLRALFADAILRLKLDMPNPGRAVQNPQPLGRSQIWLASEISRLAVGAEEMGYRGMAVAIRIAWDTLFAPVDVWTCTPAQLKRDGIGSYIERDRTKTDKGAFGALTAETAAAVAAYIDGLPFALAADAPIIRQRNGQAYRSKDTFGDDFRAVRARVFPGDKRQFLDIRRSGAVEADAAGVDKAAIGELLANASAATPSCRTPTRRRR
jgi:hypothetical protein